MYWIFAYFFALFLASCLGVLGAQLNVTGRRHLSRFLNEDLQEIRGERFALYLRAFENDSALGKQETEFRDAISSPFNAHILFNSMLTGEEQIVQALAPAGLVVAIGRPGERMPRVGALRMYAIKRPWKEVVVDLMERAQLVVLGVGAGRSLAWELFEAVQRVHPHRLVIMVLEDEIQYKEFQESVDAYFDSAAKTGSHEMEPEFERTIISRLPDFPSRESWIGWGPPQGWLISFDQNWIAKRTLLRSSHQRRNRIRGALREGMDPVFQRISRTEAADDRKLSLKTERRI
jgi:hypothetical protein